MAWGNSILNASRGARWLIAPPFRAMNQNGTRDSAKCGKLVKLFTHGTKVLSHIPHHFHPYTLKDIWRVLVLDLVS
jgi:hypothetical protein